MLKYLDDPEESRSGFLHDKTRNGRGIYTHKLASCSLSRFFSSQNRFVCYPLSFSTVLLVELSLSTRSCLLLLPPCNSHREANTSRKVAARTRRTNQDMDGALAWGPQVHSVRLGKQTHRDEGRSSKRCWFCNCAAIYMAANTEREVGWE